MRTCILIASHFHYENQSDYLFNCLFSLLNQENVDIKPTIYVSISFENDLYKQDFYKKIYNSPLFNDVNFVISDTQKYQMEHFYILTKYINDYDLVLFCDDDDTYVPLRVSIIIHIYKLGLQKFENINGIREVSDGNILDSPEYWCYGVKPSVLINFFNIFKDDMDLLKNIFGDMFLRGYFKNNNKWTNFCILNTKEKLYLYNTNNSNSICATRTDYDIFTRVKNQFYLQVISYPEEPLPDILSIEYIRENEPSIVPEIIEKVYPELEKIKRVCKVLYEKKNPNLI